MQHSPADSICACVGKQAATNSHAHLHRLYPCSPSSAHNTAEAWLILIKLDEGCNVCGLQGIRCAHTHTLGSELDGTVFLP